MAHQWWGSGNIGDNGYFKTVEGLEGSNGSRKDQKILDRLTFAVFSNPTALAHAFVFFSNGASLICYKYDIKYCSILCRLHQVSLTPCAKLSALLKCSCMSRIGWKKYDKSADSGWSSKREKKDLTSKKMVSRIYQSTCTNVHELSII